MKGLIIGTEVDESSREFIDTILKKSQLPIQWISSCGMKDTIESLHKDFPDLAFISMDSMESFGLTMTRYISTNLPRTRIVWMSNRKQQALKAYQENVWYFLELPFTEQTIAGLKNHLLSS